MRFFLFWDYENLFFCCIMKKKHRTKDIKNNFLNYEVFLKVEEVFIFLKEMNVDEV